MSGEKRQTLVAKKSPRVKRVRNCLVPFTYLFCDCYKCIDGNKCTKLIMEKFVLFSYT